MVKFVKDVVGVEMRVYDYKIEDKVIPNLGNGSPVEVLTLLCKVDNGPEFEVESTSKVLIKSIRGMDFSDGVGKRTIIQREVGQSGNEYYYFVRGL
jgi:hypothetical protein